MLDVIPEEVYKRLHRHLVTTGNRAQSGWDAGSDEEDTLTGHLGAQLQRGWSRRISVGDEHWRWRVRYKKFRGRGPGAFESHSGADGIVQIEVSRQDGTIATKGILFQAKKGDLRRARKTLDQVEKMESLAPESSGVFVYLKEGYRALAGASLLEAVGEGGGFSRDELSEPLGSFLGDRFLTCEIGLRGMYFDAVRELLVLPPQRGVTAVRAALADRLLIEVQQLE